MNARHWSDASPQILVWRIDGYEEDTRWLLELVSAWAKPLGHPPPKLRRTTSTQLFTVELHNGPHHVAMSIRQLDVAALRVLALGAKKLPDEAMWILWDLDRMAEDLASARTAEHLKL
jgi:hypothetical protein